ncbi:hypothetical protein ABZ752_00365 [Streptomyces roseifaciens]
MPWTVAGTWKNWSKREEVPWTDAASSSPHWHARLNRRPLGRHRPSAVAATHGRRVGAGAAELFETRLDTLRHLDDAVGSTHAHDAALAELRLITGVLTTSTYSDTTGRRLYAAAAEACRPAGWCAYDNGRLADGEKHFTASLRAAATEGHATLGASTLAFWANLRYSGGDPYGALGPVERALDNRYKITSGRYWPCSTPERPAPTPKPMNPPPPTAPSTRPSPHTTAPGRPARSAFDVRCTG